MTLAFLQSSGTSPCVKLLLNMAVSRGAISSANSFSNRAGMVSGPLALLGLTFFSSLRTPSSETVMESIVGYGSPGGSGISMVSSCVKVDSYCLPRMSALSFEAEKSLPFSLSGEIPDRLYYVSVFCFLNYYHTLYKVLYKIHYLQIIL